MMKKLITFSLLASTLAVAKNDVELRGVDDIIFDAGHFEVDAQMAFSSFEEPTGFISDQFTSTGDSCTDHDLVNNVDQSPVNTTPFVTTELGFTGRFIAPDPCNPGGFDDGLSNDWTGVTDFDLNLTDVNDVPVGGFSHGDQGYQITDVDGTLRLTSEIVDLTGRTNITVSVDYFLDDRSHFDDPPDPGDWEGDDSLKIYALNVDTMAQYSIVDLEGTNGVQADPMEDQSYQWNSAVMAIPDNVRIQIVIEGTNDSGREVFYIDNVEVRGL